MNGKLMFEGNEVVFSFNGSVLDLYLNNGEGVAFLYEQIGSAFHSCQKPLISERYEGYTFDNQKVVFYVEKEKYGFNASLDAKNAIFHIFVFKYLFISEDSRYNNSLIFESTQFHKFLDLIPLCNLTGYGEDVIAKITLNSSLNNVITSFTYDGIDFSIKTFAKLHSKGKDFDFTPCMSLEGTKCLDETSFLKLTDIFYKIFSFLFMRRNIFPDAISYYGNNKRYDIHIVKSENYVFEDENIYSTMSYGFICWGALTNIFQNIFDDFLNDNIYLEYLGGETKSRMRVSFDTVFKYSAFFESVFTMVYGTGVNHKETSQKINDELKKLLDDFAAERNNKTKRTVNFLKKQLDHIALGEKMEKVFDDYSLCLSVIKKDVKLSEKTNEEIAEICSDTRNATDHGDKRAKIDSDIASCFAFLISSCYAMLLKKWGMSDEFISYQLTNLFKVVPLKKE